MHVVQVKVSILDRERAERELHEEVIQPVSQAPGFVCGYWLEPEGDQGGSFVVFETEEQANAMAERARQRGDSEPDLPVRFDEITVRGVIGHA